MDQAIKDNYSKDFKTYFNEFFDQLVDMSGSDAVMKAPNRGAILSIFKDFVDQLSDARMNMSSKHINKLSIYHPIMRSMIVAGEHLFTSNCNTN